MGCIASCNKKSHSKSSNATTHSSSSTKDDSSDTVVETSCRSSCQSRVLAQLSDSIGRGMSSSNRCNSLVHIEAASRSIESVYDGVHDGLVLGYGIGGLVRMITHRETGATYALKTLSLSQIETRTGLQQLRDEVAILMEIDHPNIVKLEGVYEDANDIYLVQELLKGGDLFDRLDAQPEEHYNEAQCARLVKQMLSAVRYIHSKGIIHRDLKLENFLFQDTSADSELVLIDFGLSKHFRSGDVHHEPVGTRYTVAPEVLHGSYDERVDLWAIGVITFLLLSGESPFGGCGDQESLAEVRTNILNANYSFRDEIWKHVSADAKAFISMLLVTDPELRPTTKECQNNPWLVDCCRSANDAGGGGTKESGELNANVIKSLRAFRNFSDMRKLLCEVIGFTLLPDQIADLRKEFEKLDVEQTGEISLESLKQVLLDGAGSGNLGDLVEDEVIDIFNALRLHKEDTHIHWHEFIAAGLSSCTVKEMNHRLAFDRLDADHKGYITFEDFMSLVGNDAVRREDSMKRLWQNNKEVSRAGSRIYFDDFVRIMMPGSSRV